MSKTFAIVGAGPGGLNITHSEPLDVFLGRYGESRPRRA